MEKSSIARLRPGWVPGEPSYRDSNGQDRQEIRQLTGTHRAATLRTARPPKLAAEYGKSLCPTMSQNHGGPSRAETWR